MKLQAGIFFLLFTILISVHSYAQEGKVWTLEECINYALENNINVKKQSLNISYQEELLLQSKLGILPNVNGYFSHGYNWGQRVDPFTNEFATDRVRSNNIYLSADVNLFSGLQQLNTIKKNKLDLMASQFDVDYQRDEISITVATQYVNTLFYLEFVEIAKNQLDITKQTVARTRKLVEAGTLAKGDLLIIEAQEASEELSLINAENSLMLAYLDLSQTLELNTPEGFEIEKPELGLIDKPELFTPDKIYTTALDNRPEIRSAEYRVESSVADLNIARARYYPRLILSGSLGSGYSGANQIGKNEIFFPAPQIGETAGGEAVYALDGYSGYESYEPKKFNDQFEDNLNETVGLSLNIPIFNGWSARSNVALAKIGIESANYDLELQKNNLNKIIHQAYNDAVAAINKHEAAQKKVKATSESFKYAEQKYEVGLMNSVEYNDAKKEYNNALAELVQAKYDYVFRNTVIDFYLGKPLTLER